MEVSGPWLSRRRTPAQGRLPTQREEGDVGTSQLPKKGERIREELDELDDLLEENAEEFVASYVRRGGQ